MSLIGALNAGATGLAVSQASIQTTGNNISNSGDANYVRETTQQSPSADQQISQGIFVGTGVSLTSVQRQVDEALNSRLRSSTSDSQSATTTQQWLDQVQSVFNALGTTNLQTSMSQFFDSWSTLANTPSDNGQRQIVIQDGQALAQEFSSQVTQLNSLSTEVTTSISAQVNQADTLSTQIASLNSQIVVAEGGSGAQANSLLDQRDGLLSQLSQLMPITTVAQPSGAMNVYVGSEPLVTDNTSRGVTLANQTVNGVTSQVIAFKSDNLAISLNGGGQLGALQDMTSRITGVVDQVNTLAHNLIFELNKVHSSGQGLQGYDSVTATNTVADPTQPLDSSAAGLQFTPNNGSFVIHVVDKTTGADTSTLIPVNLTGSPSDTSLNSLVASLNGVSGVSASIVGGALKISSASSTSSISFSQDSSGTLAALGINSFYTGTDATNIAVNQTLVNQPQLLAAAMNGQVDDNQTALAIAQLGSQPVSALGGASLNDSYQSMINGVAAQDATAQSNASAATAVQTTLQSQRDALSGVSIDEETVNLLKQQQAFMGASKLISVVDQLMQTIIGMVQ